MAPNNTVSQGGIFYAGLFNQVKLAIGSINSTYIADKAKDNPIRASDLNTLVTMKLQWYGTHRSKDKYGFSKESPHGEEAETFLLLKQKISAAQPKKEPEQPLE